MGACAPPCKESRCVAARSSTNARHAGERRRPSKPERRGHLVHSGGPVDDRALTPKGQGKAEVARVPRTKDVNWACRGHIKPAGNGRLCRGTRFGACIAVGAAIRTCLTYVWRVDTYIRKLLRTVNETKPHPRGRRINPSNQAASHRLLRHWLVIAMTSRKKVPLVL